MTAMAETNTSMDKGYYHSGWSMIEQEWYTRLAKSRKLNKAEVIAIIAEANELFGTDFKLTGGWAKNGFSIHDIDLTYGWRRYFDENGRWRGPPEEDERDREKVNHLFFASALFISKKTGMIVDLFSCEIKIRLENHFVVHPDGDCYRWIDRAMEEAEKEMGDGHNAE